MKIRENIPNAITLMNLASGCIAITEVIYGRSDIAALWIFLAAIFDFFDGFAARILKAQSAIGKDLDSLADLVSFGLAPGLLLFIQIRLLIPQNPTFILQIMPYMALSIPLSAAVRLAKFNHDTGQSDKFIGLPSPACGLFIAALIAPTGVAIQIFDSMAYGWLFTARNLAIIALILAWLMNSKIHLFALKFKGFGWQINQLRYAFIVFGLIMMILFQAAGIAIIIPAYILVSLLMGRWNMAA